MTTKERLHRLVDSLPNGRLEAAQRLLEELLDTKDPLVRKLLDAPEDYEGLTEEDEAALQEAYEDRQAGRVVSLEDVKRELGL